MDVAPYFEDPDNDPLTYSATSNRTGTVTVSMSGSTVTLTPVSAGTATVTVTAGAGDADATQAMVTTVQEPENRAPHPAESTPAQTTPTMTTTVQEPENTLSGIRVMRQNSQARETSMRISLEPADARWSGITFDIDPYEAGNMCCYQSFAESIYIKFTCSNGYTGNAAITIFVSDPGGHRVQDSVSFTCR